ncbi:hypothetical protein EJ08DRAFT_340880 [Tothia fuscella]|uniref:Uncharacterized protein n=1 Tax=Tothia fuscella TaxID=1048955 RepID=A0A9P4U3Y1_9PEZI|nr:hypothetical protein EJ08DRAFT_340880 [Tothia fuscella]
MLSRVFLRSITIGLSALPTRTNLTMISATFNSLTQLHRARTSYHLLLTIVIVLLRWTETETWLCAHVLSVCLMVYVLISSV